jgi:hypothetical protein
VSDEKHSEATLPQDTIGNGTSNAEKLDNTQSGSDSEDDLYVGDTARDTRVVDDGFGSSVRVNSG